MHIYNIDNTFTPEIQTWGPSYVTQNDNKNIEKEFKNRQAKVLNGYRKNMRQTT